jgi:hypothetical protein
VPGDRNTKKVGEISEICHGELVVKKLTNMQQKVRSRCNEDDVINVQQNVGEGITMAQHKQ